MSRFVKGKSSDKAQVWLQRLVKFWLASGMIVMPWSVYGSEITRTDGGANINGTGVHNIYAGKQLSDTVGASTFSKFDVTAGDVANMHFRTSSVSTTNFNTLLNFVDAKININGTVNAIRNGNIGGNLYFLSPNGMAVGANGAINAGSLTVLTPTNAWWKDRSMVLEKGSNAFAISKLTTDDINAVNALTIPINATGTIAVQGKINVTNDLRLKAAKINIGADGDGNSKTAAVLQSGVVDFSDIVNIKDLTGTGITDTDILKTVVEPNGGDIILAAEVSVNENDCSQNKLIDKQEATAEVNVVGGSKINAYRNVDITALAVNNVELGEYVNPDTNEWTYIVNGKEITEEQFKSQYQSEDAPATAEEPAKLSMYGSTTKIYAKINVADAGTEITGENVNIKAEAKNVYQNCSDVSYLDQKKIDDLDEEYFKKTNTDFWFSYLMNGMDVVYGDMTTEATVTIGQDTVVLAKAPDREETVVGSGTTYIPALQIGANATTEIDLGTQALSINATHTQTIPGVGFIWGMIHNKSNVTVAGTLQTDKGSTSVQSVANAKVHENADTGYGSDARAFTSDAGFNFGVVVFVGDNEANLDIKDTAKMRDLYGNITIGASAVNNLDLNNDLKTSDRAATAFGISWMDFDANANVNIAAAVESKNGNITTFAESTLPVNNFITYAEAGDAGFFSGYTKIQRLAAEQSIRNNINNKLNTILSTSSSGSGSNNLSRVILTIHNLFQTSDAFMKSMNEKMKMGISLGVAKQTNVAKVNIASTGSLKAKGDVKVTAKAAIEDIRFQVYGSSSNAQVETSGPQSGKDLLANGAVMVSSVENDADITIENGDRNALEAGGSITLRTDTLLPYNRIDKMVNAINQYIYFIEHSFDNMKGDTTSYSANDIAAMEAALADFTKKATALQAELYDENGNLKPEYADSSDGYSALIEKINAFTEDPTMENFTEFIQGGTYTYTDDQGQQHSVKFDNKTGSGTDAGSNCLKDTLTKIVDDAMLALGGIKGLAGAALDFAEPANYVNYYVGSATKGNKNRDLTTNVAAAIDLGMTSTWNKSRIIVGSDAKIISDSGNVSMDANTEANDASLTGKIGSTGGGKKASIGAAIGLAEVNNLSMISLADNSQIEGNDVSLNAKNYTNHVAVGELLNYSTGNEGVTVNGIGLFVGGNSDSIISVDDEADITATGNISLLGENTTNGIMVGGGLACGNKGAESLTFGMMLFNRNNYVTVGDNDAENLFDTAIGEDDEEKLRLKKLIAQQSGMDADTRKKYFGTTAVANKGEITGISLSDKAISDGDMVNVVIDIGYGSDTASQTADQVGQKISGAASNVLNAVGSWSSALSVKCSNMSRAISKMFPSGNAGNIPAVSFDGTGSVAINDIDAHTLALVDGTNISLTPGDNAKFAVYAEDTGTIVSVAGGVGYSGKKSGSGVSVSGSKTGIAMAGGAAVNLVDNYTTAQIGNTGIDGAKDITNEAVREGLLVAAGAAVNVTDSQKGQGTGVSIGGSTSVNIAHYGTIANMENNRVNANFSDYKTNLTNEARNQDAQGSGCLNLSLAIEGKSGGAVGGVVSYDEINNDVEANMTKGGTYENMGAVVNMAKADLTQIQAALGMGIYAGQGGGIGTTLEGSAAVGIFSNKMQANVDGITLVGDTFTSKAFDENFENDNSHIAKAAEQGLDLTGEDYIRMAKDEALNDGETLRQSGNTLVNVAVQIGAAAGKQGTDVAVGAAVGLIESDNEYVASMRGSNITANSVDTLAESSTLEVGVAAGGNGSGKGFAGGGAVAVTLMNDKVIDEVETSDITADVLTLQALNKNELINVTGEVAVGADKKASAAGLDVTYNYLGTVTKTLLENTDVQGRTADTGANVTMLSQNDADYYSVAVGVAIAGDVLAVNGSVSLNQGRNDTYAIATSNGSNTLSLNELDVDSIDDSYYCAGAGGLGMVYGRSSVVAVGGAVAYNQLGVELDEAGNVVVSGKTQHNKAEVRGYDITLLSPSASVDVNAADAADMLTVAVGVGLSNGKVAVQGASADTFLYKDTEAGIYDTNVNKSGIAQGEVNVNADTHNKTESVAVVVAGTTGAVAVGAGVNVVTMDGDTAATLAGGTYKVDEVLVNADSYQKLLSNVIGVAASETVTVGGSVTVSNLNNDTYATLGSSNSSNITKIDADGNVGVLAQSDEDFENYTGAATIAFGTAKAEVGVGAAVAVNQTSGDTIAKAQNAEINTKAATGKSITLRNSITGAEESYKGFVVDADAYHKFYDAPWSGGLSVATASGVPIGVNATVAVDDMGGSTRAEVYSVSLNKDKTSIESDNDFVVQATDKTDAEPVITNAVVDVAVSASTGVGIGLGAGVGDFENSRIVEASVIGDKTNNRYVMNADEVKVNGDSKLNFKTINTAVSVVVATGVETSVGVSSATGVSCIGLESETRATMKDVESTNNGLSLTANNDLDFNLTDTSVTLAVAASMYGVGIGVGVHVDTIKNDSKVIALLDSSEIYHYTDNTAEDVISAHSNYYAHNQDCNVNVGASTLSGAVGVLVVDNDLNNVVTADVKNSIIGTENKQAKDIEVSSLNEIMTDFDNQNIAVGTILSVGVGVGLNTANASVAANVTSSTFYAGHDIDVNAEQKVTMLGEMVAVPVGCASVGVSTLHSYMDKAVVDDQYENWEDENTNAEELKNNDFSSKNIDDLVVFGTEQGDEILNSVEREYASYGDIKLSSMAKVNRSASISSTGTKVNLTNAQLHAGNDINAMTKDTVNTDPEITAVGVGALQVNVETNRVRIANDIGLNVTGGIFEAGHDINLNAATAGCLKADTIMVGVGATAVGVAIGEITKDGSMGITLNTAYMDADGSINIVSKDNMSIEHTGTGSGDGAVSATAVDYVAKDNLVNRVTLKYDSAMQKGNSLEAAAINVNAYSVPGIKSEFLAVSVALAEGCGVVMESTMNNQAILNVENDNRLWADSVTLDSGVFSGGISVEGNTYNLYSDVMGVGVAGVAVHVNKSRTNSDVVARTNVGSVIFKTEDEKDKNGNTVKVGKSKVTINAFDATNTYNHLQGVTVGAGVASGTNFVQSKLKSSVSATVNAGSDGIYADTLSVTANGKDVLKGRANGDGGGVVDISPEAAKVELEIDGVTTTNVRGLFDVQTWMSVDAIRTDDMDLNANTIQAEIAGGSGTKVEINHINETTTVNVEDATIVSRGKLDIASTNNVYVNKDNNAAVEGNGYGGIDISVSDLKNRMNLNSVVNIDSTQIHGYDRVNISANTVGNVVLDNSVFSAGIVSSDPCGKTDSNITLNNKVNIKDSNNKGTEIRTETVDKDLTIATAEDIRVFVRSYTEAAVGVLGVVVPEAYSTIVRNNTINLEKGTLYSTRDINLYSGQKVDGSLSYMNIKVESEAFNNNLTSAIPCGIYISDKIEQNNNVNISGQGNVRSIRHTNIYADSGNESIYEIAQYHSGYGYTDDQGSNFVSKSNGDVDSKVNRNNNVTVDGSVVAGLANVLTINIGTVNGEFVIVGDQERSMVQAANPGKTVYSGSDADKAKFITFGDDNSQTAAATIGLTVDDFIVGRQSYSQAVGDRLNEVNALLSDYNKDSDKEVYEGLKAEQQRLTGIMESMNVGNSSSDGTINPDLIDYILVPELVASGGNVVVQTKNFNGTGRVEAKGNPKLEVNNYTNLMLVTSAITVDDPGGVIYYNNIALDPNLSESMQNQVKKLNDSNAAVNLTLEAAKGTDASVKVTGHYSSGNIKFDEGYYYYVDESGNKVVYKPNDVVTFSGSTNGLYYELTTEDGKENYDYYINIWSSNEKRIESGKYYFTKDRSRAVWTDHVLTANLYYKETETGTEKPIFWDEDPFYRYYYIDTSDGKYYLADKYYTQASERVHYQSGRLKYDDGKFIPYDTTKDNQYYDVIAAGNFRPKADIQIAGNISSLNGLARIESKNNSITIGGQSVMDDISINAQVVQIVADNGGITQNYTDGTINIGGDVVSQYSDLYNAFVNKNKQKTGKTMDNSNKLITTEPSSTGGGWIAGGQVYIAANDININGVIQSGYDKYSAEITAADQTTIDNIKASWNANGKPQLSDTAVQNSGSTYLVKAGGSVWNSTRKCYEYKVGVYYNPSTNQLVTTNINANGGRIYLTGRIASTGSGNVICLDGTYDINIKNSLNYDLRLGELVVNDTQGLISITDPSYTVAHGNENFTVTADITTSGTKYSYYDSIDDKRYNSIDNPEKFKGINYVTGSGRNYSYAPESGLRYNWVTGYGVTTYTEYTTEEMAHWWGLDDYDPTGKEKVLNEWIEEGNYTIKSSGTGAEVERSDGAYLSTSNSKADVHFKHTGEVIGVTVYESADVREWSSGFLGCHKYREYTYTKEEGSIYADYASVKADNAINITMIGVAAADSMVKVDTTQNIYFGQNIGNSLLYQEGNKYVEKGTVDLQAANGSIIQEGGNIYGATVNLSAQNDLQNIHIVAGDSVNLTGTLKGTGVANILVDKAYGGGVGNVILNNLGGTNGSLVDLTAAGNITQNTASDLVQAKRINLTAGGSVTGQNGTALYLIGGQDVDADSQDSLRASVNIDAKGNVNINQKSGDLRIGTIYSGDGDVTISVPEGSIRDALPYVEDDSQQTEADLLAKWEKDGLIDDDDDPATRTEIQISRDKILAAAAASKETYITNINNQFKKYLELKAAYEDPKKILTVAERKIYTTYNSKFAGYSTAADYLAQDPTAVAMLEKLQNNVAEITAIYGTDVPGEYKYTGWNKYLLLYALQDAVINKHAGVVSSAKAPNIYGNNVNLTVKNDVGLNSPNVTVIDLTALDTTTEEGLKTLQLLSRADAATVDWTIDHETGHKIVTVTEKLAIGLHQKDDTGRINVTTTDTDVKNTKNVFLEVREDVTGVNNYLSLNIGNINAAAGNGDVRISSLKDIVADSNFVLAARDVVLLAGEAGTRDGDIGSADNYFHLDMTGELTATATGNIYLSQSSKDWYIKSMAAGTADVVGSADSGNIYLQSAGNIYGIYDIATDVQGYIQTDGAGIISIISAGGEIGDWDDSSKILRVKNNARDVQLEAAGDIVLEGVSVVNGDVPAGILVVTKAQSGTEKVKLNVNGAVKLGTEQHEFGTIYLDSALDATVKGSRINDFTITNTHSNNTYMTTINEQVLKLDNVTKGMINVHVYKGTQKESTALQVNGDLYATDSIVLTNETGDLNSVNSGDNKVFTEKFFVTYSAGKITQDKDVLAKSGIAYIADGDVDAGSEYTMGQGLYVQSLNGNVNAENLNGVGLIKGNLSLIAENGSITNSVAYLAEGDITLKAKDSIDNNASLSLSDAQKKDLTERQIEIIEGLGMRSLNGNINVITEGTLTNTTGMLADNGNVVLSGKVAVVNNSDILAKAGTVRITSEGSVTNGNDTSDKIFGYRGVTVAAGTDMTNGADLYANTGDVAVTAGASLSNSGKMFVVQEGNVKVTAGTTLTNNNGHIYTKSGEVELTSGEDMSNSGNIFAEAGNVALSAKAALSNTAGAIFSRSGNVTLTAINNLDNTSSVYALNGEVTLQSAQGNVTNDNPLTSKEGMLSGSISLLAEKGSVNNTSVLAAVNDITIKAKNSLAINLASADYGLYAQNGTLTLNVSDGYLTNASILNAGKDVVLNASSYISNSNTGTVSAMDGVVMTAGDYLMNDGSITATNKDVVLVSEKNLSNTNILTANNGVVALTSDAGDITNSGEINAQKDVLFAAAENISNDGTIIATAGNVVLDGGNEISNSQAVTATVGNINIAGADIINSGSLQAGSKVTAIAVNSVTNTNAVTAGSEVVLTAVGGTLHNEGSVSGMEITLISGDDLSNSGILTAGNNIVVTSGDDLINDGAMTAAGGDLTISAKATLNNNDGGNLTAGENVRVTADGTLTNKGAVEATNGFGMLISSNGAIDNQADVSAKLSVGMIAAGGLSHSGNITSSDATVSMLAKNGIFSSSGTVNAGKAVLMTSMGNALTNNGSITAGSNVVMTSEGILQTTGDVTAKLTVNMRSDADLTNDGMLTATDGKVSLLAEGNLINKKNISAGTNALLNTNGGTLDNQGAITANQNVELLALSGKIGNTGGTITATEGNVTMTAGTGEIENQAMVTAGKYVTMTAATALSQNGSIAAGKEVTMTANGGTLSSVGDIEAKGGNVNIVASDALSTSGGIIDAKDNIYMTGYQSVTNTAEMKACQSIVVTAVTDLSSNGNITATAAQIDFIGYNTTVDGGTLTAGRDVNIIAQENVTNHGQLWAKNNVSVNGKDLLSTGNILAEGGQVTLRARGTLVNGANTGIQDETRIHGKTGVRIDARSTVTNYAHITSAGDVTLAAPVGLINSGVIWTTNGGNVLLGNVLGDCGSLTNSGRIIAQGGGDVNILSKGQLNNLDTGNIFALGGGDVTIVTTSTMTNAGRIMTTSKKGDTTTTCGDVNLTSAGDLVNSGDIILFDNKQGRGSLKLTSVEGNIDNKKGNFIIAGQTVVDDVNNILSGTGYIIEMLKDQTTGADLVDGSVALSAEQGNIFNNKIMVANKDINMTARSDANNNGYALTSLHGNITLVTLGTGDGEGNIENTGGLTANEGKVYLSAARSVTNSAPITAAEVDIESQGTVINSNKIDVTALADGTNADLLNNGNITINAVRNITNGTAKDENVYAKTNKGNIKITSSEGEINNYSHLTTEEGNVILKGYGNVKNTGNIVAKLGSQAAVQSTDLQRGYGWAALISETGNITNNDTFNSEGYNYAEGSIWLAAQKGSISNANSLIANNNIVVKSNAVVNMENKVTKSLQKGNILLSVCAQDATGIINNVSEISTADGNIFIYSQGSKEETKTINVTDYDPDTKTLVDRTVTVTVPVSVYNASTGSITANNGNVLIRGNNAVINEGDIIATAGENTENTGNITITSVDGGVLLYNVDKGTGNNKFAAGRNIIINAPNGILYNEKDLLAVGDVVMEYGGPATGTIGGQEYIGKSITVNNIITSETGDIKLSSKQAGTYLVLNSQITAKEGKADIVSAGSLVVEDNGNDYGVKAYSSAILNAGGDVTVSANVISEDADVNIAAKGNVKVTGDITASTEHCLAAVGTENGNLDVTGKLTGRQVVIYTENADSVMSFGEINVIDELTLVGNHWVNDTLSGDENVDMSKVTMGDNCNIRLYSAGGSNDGAIYKLDFSGTTKQLNLSEISADTIEIKTDGPVTIQDLSVSNIAKITAMGTKTDVYGKIQDYDGDAKVIYYAPGRGAGATIDLHDMFFDGNAESYQNVMDQYKQDSTTGFVTAGNATGSGVDGNGKGMYLGIRTATEQTGDGLLLRNYYGQTTYRQRYSLEQLMQHLLNFKATDSCNRYFNTGWEIYEKYNLLEISGITVNQPVNLNNCGFEIEGTTTNDKGEKVKKVVKYEF